MSFNRCKLFVMVGISGSGKSYKATEIAVQYNAIIVAIDEIEKQFPIMKNKELREEKILCRFCNRIRENLERRRNVVADASNISMYSRRRILNVVRSLQVEKICYLMAQSYEDCVRDSKKKGTGADFIRRQIKKYEIPFREEGWDKIEIYDASKQKYSFGELLSQMEGFDQKNPHHNRNLLAHCSYTAKLYRRECEHMDSDFGNFAGDVAYQAGAELHDIGKLYCQTMDEEGIGHYYQHHSIGAYYILTHMERTKEFAEDDKLLDCCFLINYHMLPFMWKNEKTKVRWKKRFGEYKYRMLTLFHLCDIKREE